MKSGSPGLIVVVVLALALGAGCGDSDPEPESLELTPLRWNAVEGARTHRVRAWAGSRLLFEVVTSADSLPWSPALRRAAAPFDTVDVRVQGLDPREEPVGGVRTIRVRPRVEDPPGR